MLSLLQAGKADIYWRGYFWLSAGSPEPLNIPTYPYFWQLFLRFGSKSKVCLVAAFFGRTLHAILHHTDAAKRCGYGLFFRRLPIPTDSLWLPTVPQLKCRKIT